MNTSPLRIFLARPLLAFALALVPAGLWAAAVGTNHPASGAYSPDNQAAWGTANWPLGATFTAGPGSTLQIGVYSANATTVVLEIYLADTGADAAYDYTMTKGSDNVWRAAVANAPAYTLYAFRAWGPNWPFNANWARGNSTAGFLSDCDSSGNRFNPNKVLFDPYARELSHDAWTPATQAAGESFSMYASGGANIASGQTYSGPLSGGVAIDCRKVDSGHWAPKAVALVDNTSTGPKPNLSQKDAIIYEAHVKGLTAHPSSVNLTTLLSAYSGFQDAANVPNNLRGTYAGAAYMAGYLKDLGFNTVEFLPIHETDNADNPSNAPTSGGGGYWGYYTYGFFAPDRRFASNQTPGGPTAEFKAMVAAFHNAGIEVYLDVVYNHSGEGGVWDASTAAQAEVTFLRGLDNASYYTLVTGTPKYYWVSTGVGTNLNGGSAPVEQLVTDSLTYWAGTMGVDGFRFDEALELGRNGSGNFSSTAPLLVSIASLAKSSGFKIIAEPWDANDGSSGIGGFPAGWACWNGNYRDSIRYYMTGNLTGYVNGAGNLGYADAFYGDSAKMTAEGGPHESVNMVVCHDGFNITDLVSYGSQTNSSLTWPFGPSDGGTNNNLSSTWSGDQTLRRQIIRDFWTFQVLSRGLPMMVWGDEFGRTANGNNNSYNVDSVATWNNYNMIGTNSPDTVPTGDTTGGSMAYANNLGTFAGTLNGNFAFLQYLLHLRSAHPAFRQQDYTSETIAFANSTNSGTFNQAATSTVQIYLHGSQVADDDFLVLSNLASAAVTYTIPAAPANTHWVRIIDTNNSSESLANFWSTSNGSVVAGTCSVGSRTIVVLEAVPLAVAPAITLQPSGQTATVGRPVTFTAAASGTPAPTYQWQKNNVNINGATGASYSLAHVVPADAGSYKLVASNSAGTAASNAAALTVKTVAADFNVDGGSDVLWQDTATGERVIWLMNGTAYGSAVSLGVVPANWVIGGTGDFNGDGWPDILWTDLATGERRIWLMNGTGYASATSLGVIATDWMFAGTGDFNGDGQTDILWENTATGEHTVWFMNGTVYASSASLGVVPRNWFVSAIADFDRDGHPDLVWTNSATGERTIWMMNGVTHSSTATLGIVPADLQISSTGDYNGDGSPDLVVTNTATNERSLWLMNGAIHTGTVSLGIVPAEWSAGKPPARAVQLAKLDFNGDGQSDLVWENTATGEHVVWFMNGPAPAASAPITVLPPPWRLAASADFNADAQPDLVWENTATGERYLWLMNGSTFAASIFLGVVPTQWRIAEAADFNGDGQADLVWENTSTGERYIWLLNGSTFTAIVFLGVVPAQWRIASVGDFNGDGQPDLVWENTATGERYVWLMNGTSLAASVFLGVVPTQWRIATAADFNGDGQPDLVWENTATGERVAWLMGGTTFASSVSWGVVPVEWSIRN